MNITDELPKESSKATERTVLETAMRELSEIGSVFAKEWLEDKDRHKGTG